MNEAVRAGVDGNFRLFVVSFGGGPSGEQRGALAEIVRKASTPPMAMLTDSKLVRALMFAFSFINRSTKVLGLNDADAAFDFLGLDGEQRNVARRLRRELEAQLGLTGKTTRAFRRRSAAEEPLPQFGSNWSGHPGRQRLMTSTRRQIGCARSSSRSALK